MTWDNSLNTGIDTIDQQHKALVEHIVEFYDACEQQHGKDVIYSTLDFLESYVIKHFTYEEGLQETSQYPKRAIHKDLHRFYIEDMGELKNRIDEEGLSPEVMCETSKFLMEWLVDHISVADMEFAAYYKANVTN
jgi:hemerythrin